MLFVAFQISYKQEDFSMTLNSLSFMVKFVELYLMIKSFSETKKPEVIFL